MISKKFIQKMLEAFNTRENSWNGENYDKTIYQAIDEIFGVATKEAYFARLMVQWSNDLQKIAKDFYNLEIIKEESSGLFSIRDNSPPVDQEVLNAVEETRIAHLVAAVAGGNLSLLLATIKETSEQVKVLVYVDSVADENVVMLPIGHLIPTVNPSEYYEIPQGAVEFASPPSGALEPPPPLDLSALPETPPGT